METKDSETVVLVVIVWLTKSQPENQNKDLENKQSLWNFPKWGYFQVIEAKYLTLYVNKTEFSLNERKSMQAYQLLLFSHVSILIQIPSYMHV